MNLVRRLTLPPTVLAILAGTLLCCAAVARADSPSVQKELQLEQSCKSWQKVRRCITDDGQIGLECASKGPLARFFALFHDRGNDNEVHVVVVREAPEAETDDAAAAHSAQSAAPAHASGAVAASEPATAASPSKKAESKTLRRTETTKQAKVVHRHGHLPHCGDGR